MNHSTLSQMAVDFVQKTAPTVGIKIRPLGYHGYGGARKVKYEIRHAIDGDVMYYELDLLGVAKVVAHLQHGLMLPGSVLRDPSGKECLLLGAKVARGKYLFLMPAKSVTEYEVEYYNGHRAARKISAEGWTMVDAV
ncbi:hypothetical protein UFOVP569_17 [uncultured Caudovirales phage]|uniref:Uncharacterized protein n=1 Tax=uncultured Caudovirales phage TaxID=2100421 RepID=A0A6J7XE36_9CAUD|nr:hypothetical protein UFOVP569_17 [uncultured Caudovirales phage]CAB4183113.1 hypothetical protein UFOVP1093_34 [uncultured Caudovirales phage]CAB4200208.1 hypothetical protein UFOVP1340_33 [uncultured Caudovirales phage]CAB4213554.1 hypothetical protein UFOVP1448_45 [uncultured Caudovirales phage]CAB4218455.1 hypothetical protein UFOVP1600_16 [uncultured Caudovirales phage]